MRCCSRYWPGPTVSIRASMGWLLTITRRPWPECGRPAHRGGARGFGHLGAEVDATVRQAADAFRNLGATVDEVSIPLTRWVEAIWLPIAAEGATMQMMLGNGWLQLEGAVRHQPARFPCRLAAARRRAVGYPQADDAAQVPHDQELPGALLRQGTEPRPPAEAAYDGVLADYDLLLMPTLPMKATRLLRTTPIGEIVARALEMIPNTSPFDVTGHPAMSVPCGMVDGLPVGAMLIGRHYAEKTIYRAADAYEQEVDWRVRGPPGGVEPSTLERCACAINAWATPRG